MKGLAPEGIRPMAGEEVSTHTDVKNINTSRDRGDLNQSKLLIIANFYKLYVSTDILQENLWLFSHIYVHTL
jgi:hypothetical protein